MRRGGFGDSGSVSGTGELPRAEPVAVLSEEQLRQELEAVASSLVPSAEWTHRVEALLRLEGLVLGGAAQYANFAEGMTALVREPLVSQVRPPLGSGPGMPPPQQFRLPLAPSFTLASA